jgi:hypothetical protein
VGNNLALNLFGGQGVWPWTLRNDSGVVGIGGIQVWPLGIACGRNNPLGRPDPFFAKLREADREILKNEKIFSKMRKRRKSFSHLRKKFRAKFSVSSPFA